MTTTRRTTVTGLLAIFAATACVDDISEAADALSTGQSGDDTAAGSSSYQGVP